MCLHTNLLFFGLRSTQPERRGSITEGGFSWRSLGANWWYLTSNDAWSASYISFCSDLTIWTIVFALTVIIKYSMTWPYRLVTAHQPQPDWLWRSSGSAPALPLQQLPLAHIPLIDHHSKGVGTNFALANVITKHLKCA